MPTRVNRPHLRFREIRGEAIDAAVAIFEAKPWRLATDAEKCEAVKPFVDQICTAYRAVPAPNLTVAPHIWARFSYRPGSRTALSSTDQPGMLTLKKFTIIDLFGGIRQHINTATGSRLDTFAWACSLFYAAKPTMFRARVREGRIPGVVARATYSQETWDTLVSEGLADPTTGRMVVTEVPSEETMDAVADYVDALIEDEATEGIDELSAMLAGEIDDDEEVEAETVEDYDEEEIPGSENIPDDDEPGDAGYVVPLPSDLDSMNRDALRQEAARLNIPGRGSMLAPALREAIREARNG